MHDTLPNASVFSNFRNISYGAVSKKRSGAFALGEKHFF